MAISTCGKCGCTHVSSQINATCVKYVRRWPRRACWTPAPPFDRNTLPLRPPWNTQTDVSSRFTRSSRRPAGAWRAMKLYHCQTARASAPQGQRQGQPWPGQARYKAAPHQATKRYSSHAQNLGTKCVPQAVARPRPITKQRIARHEHGTVFMPRIWARKVRHASAKYCGILLHHCCLQVRVPEIGPKTVPEIWAGNRAQLDGDANRSLETVKRAT